MKLKQKVFKMACRTFFYSCRVRSIGVKYTANSLGVSKYKVRKVIKELVCDGLLEVRKEDGFWTEDGPVPPQYRYIVSKKGMETEEFREAKEDDYKSMMDLPF